MTLGAFITQSQYEAYRDLVHQGVRFTVDASGEQTFQIEIPFWAYYGVADWEARAALASGAPITQVATQWALTIARYYGATSLEDASRLRESGQSVDPVFGYYAAQRFEILGMLNDLAASVGVSVPNWRDYVAAAMMQEVMRLVDIGQRPTDAFGWALPFPYLVCRPVELASQQYPKLAQTQQYVCPGSDFWNETVNFGEQTHKDFRKKSFGRLLTVLAVIAAGAFAPAASGAEGAAAGASAGTTASVSGAELAALVEAGTVGAEGAFLEAAALSGASVTYNTATGAILGAVLPSGATVAFDPALDAFTQFGVDPSQMALPDTSSGVADAITDAAQQVGEEIAGELVQLGEQEIQRAIEAEIAEAVLGEPQQTGTGTSAGGASPGYYDYYQPYEPGGPSEYQLEPGALPPGNVSATLSRAAKPLALGAGLGLLALFVLGDDERK